MSRPILWTPADDAALLATTADGGDFAVFADRMRCAPDTARARYKRLLAQMNCSDRAAARRLRDNARQRLKRQADDAAAGAAADEHAARSDAANADRIARQGLQPRDLTAAFFGDPLPGHSALDRRSSGAQPS